MTDMIALLVRNTCMMTCVAVPYIFSCAFAKNYAPKDFYGIGKLILLGFAIPLRPTILISFRGKSAIGRAVANRHTIRHDFSVFLEAAGQKEIHAVSVKGIGFSMEQLIFMIWVFGCVGMLLYRMVQYAVFLKMIKRWSSDITDQGILTAFTEMKEYLKIKSDLQIKCCACISSPMLVRLRKPAILLPDKLYTQQELRLVLHHEMVHLKRKDLLYKWVLMLAVAANWFNPIVYLFTRAFVFYGEISCDEAVTENMNENDRRQYILTIINLAAIKPNFGTIFSSPFQGGKESMKKRIHFIMNLSKKRFGYGLFAVCLSIILSSGTVFAVEPNTRGTINEGKKYQVNIVTEEDIVKEMEKAFSEVFSNEFNEADFPGMIITYDENGIPVVSDPNNEPQKRGVFASVKANKGGFYSSSDCSKDSLVFYILQGYKVEVLDSATHTDVAKVSYAGKTGYMKKSELKF